MATGATEHIDSTTAAVFIPVIYSKKAIVAREEELVFSKLVDRKFEDDAEFGGSIKVPNVSNLTAQTKDTDANAATVYETVTETNVTITIGTWEYQGIALETFTGKQADRNLLEVYAPKQGYALAHSQDAVLAGLVDDFSQTVGTLTVALQYSDVLRARQYLDDANAPQTGRAIVVSPAQETAFMELDKFIHSDYSRIQGKNSPSAMDMAYMGSWLNMPVYKTTNVEGSNGAGHDNGMFQKEALALVQQMSATTHKMFDIDTLTNKVVVEQIYGTAEIRDDHGVAMFGL